MKLGREFRIFGPPGTGKTTRLKKEVTDAAKRVGSDKIFIASFTRAAAAELVSRNLPVSKRQIGTLHRHCYDALGRPAIVDTADWNKEYPQLEIKEDIKANVDDIGGVDTAQKGARGDELYNKYQINRARMIPRENWTSDVLYFAERWEDYKKQTKTIDFMDMIEICLEEVDTAPGEPDVGFYDEAQDFTPLELALARKWGRKMKAYILAGDDDQAIYAFKGADPHAFISHPIDPNDIVVLRQSHRIPRKVQKYAERWISQIKNRQPKEYRPRDVDGELLRLPQASIRNPEVAVRHAERYLEKGKKVMFLTSCAHMLVPLMKVLQKRGILYHNPYKDRNDWNPISRHSGAAKRILDFLRPDSTVWGEEARLWLPEELRNWAKVIKAKGVIRHGMKKRLDPDYLQNNDFPVTVQFCEELFEEEAWVELATLGGLAWFEKNLMPTKRKSHDFALRLAKQYGPKKLMEEPQVIIGTIHSVKGGQADVVYLFPDLSPAGMREWGHNRESVVRSFYVGMTRCKETLVICGQATPNAVRI